MKIKGNIKDIFYKSDNYVIGTIKIKESEDEEYEKKELTFSGKFNNLIIDNDCIFIGELFEHPKYGLQFKVESYEKILPEEKNAIISFLSSGIFPKVGIRTASKIVDKFKENTIEMILKDYRNLLQISTINEKKAKSIYNILLEEKESYKTIIYLQELGFTFNQSNLIYLKHKLNTIDIIKKNIYDLVEIEEIGFLTIDKIAFNLDYKEDDERRLIACVLYSIFNICYETKNSYVLLNDIYLKTNEFSNLNIDIESLIYYLSILNKNNKIIIEKEKYYLKDFYNSEVKISKKLIKLINNKKIIYKYEDKYIKVLQDLFKIKYNNMQEESVKNFLENNVSIITGGPGTGKTTIIRAIIEVYKNVLNTNEEEFFNKMILLAPTGRAAKRMQEATNFYSSTIHKFLQYNKDKNEFLLNEKNKSNVKLVIIDEASMIDLLLFNSLLEALEDDVKVLIVGDHNQLPSILPGQILKDLIDTNIIKTTYLKELYRQKEKSYIIELASKIKDEDLVEIENKKSDFSFIECNKYNIESLIIEVCKKAIEKKYSYKDIQVLVPMYKGLNGIDNLNKKLQEIFNPKNESKKEIEYFKTIYRENDKVLQIKNLSDSNVSNGDIGIIKKIDNTIIIEFDNETVEYKKADLENIKLGYAISIHKSQGSEFDIVIMPMDSSYNRMLYKKLIYTAVTRAKKSLMIIGEKEALLKGVKNKKEEDRLTTLKEKIIGEL